MRVMIDTNVLVSALLFPGQTMDTMMQKVSTEHNLVLSSYVVDELKDVTQRKFPDKVEAVDTLLNQLPYELVQTPSFPFFHYQSPCWRINSSTFMRGL